ncbi:unnamed protein product [Paramecium primaurelia]|uniref:RING-type domain-containing protein n=1 Tax=Paramecium primaurelia TaxID=5886 RepID=A0A8S1K3S9_PARPR|nr:unnamed protein product [Paramecium primaurelia]
MYILFLFYHFGNCYEEILFQNTKGLRQLNIENKLDESIVLEAKSSQSQVSILLICDTAPNFQQFEEIYNDQNFGCICDWNAFDFSEPSQKLMLIRNSTNNMNSYSKNVKYTNNNSPYVGIFSNKYDFVNIYIYPKQSNDCIVNCKYNGECKKGTCYCKQNYFGFDCKYQGSNIFNEEYLIKSSYYYVDLKSLQDSNITIQFKKKGKLSYQCFSINPYLKKANIITSDIIQISTTEINNCLHQGNRQFGSVSYYIIQIYQEDLLYIQNQESEDSNNYRTMLIAILSTCLTFLCCIIFCVFRCYRSKGVVTNTNTNANRILMNLQTNKTTIDNSQEIAELIPTIQFSAVFKKYPQILDFNQCAICLDNFQLDQQVRVTYCQHVFHSKCFDAWIKKNSSCPICRSPQDKRTIKQQEKLQTIISQNTEFNPEVTSQKQQISRAYGETPMLTNHRSAGSSKYIQSNI